MKISIKNASNLDFKQFLPLLKSFLPFAMKKMGFDQAPNIVLASDIQNAELPLGKTAHYEPETAKITIFTDKRHPKDVLRSLSHELVHHKQNCGGEFSDFSIAEEGYTQENPHLRGLEEEAYTLGNMTFRDWEDTHKKQLQESTYYNQPNLAGDTEMNTKQWKDLEINNLLMERWGYKAPTNESIEHLCAMKVTETLTGRIGHPINHTLLKDGTVTHYDVEFDNVIVEGMPVKSLKVDVQEMHSHRREDSDYEHDESKPREEYMEEGEEFPDLTGDGEVTQADILKGKGVKLNEDGVAVHTFKQGDTISDLLAAQGHDPSMTQKIVDYHNWRSESDPSLTPIPDINKVAAGSNLMLPGEQAMMAIQDGDYGQRDDIAIDTTLDEEELPDVPPEIQSAINTNVDTTPTPPPPAVMPAPVSMPYGRRESDDLKITTDIDNNLYENLSENALRQIIRKAIDKSVNR